MALRTAENSRTVSLRVTYQEAEWIEYFARKRKKKPGGLLYEIVRNWLVEEAATNAADQSAS